MFFNNTISGGNNSIGPTLNLVGGDGAIRGVTNIALRHGGALFFDDWESSFLGIIGATYNGDRIGNNTNINFDAGTLKYQKVGNSATSTHTPEKVGDLVIRTGQNIVDFPVVRGTVDDFPQIHTSRLDWAASSRAILYIEGVSYARLQLDTSASGHAINDWGGDGIIPWAAYDQGWARPTTLSNTHYEADELSHRWAEYLE